MLGPNLNIPRYFKNAFSRPVPVDRATHEKFYENVGMPFLPLVERLSLVDEPSVPVYGFGYAHVRYYFEVRGRKILGAGDGWYREDDFAEAVRNRTLHHYMDSIRVPPALFDRLGQPHAALGIGAKFLELALAAPAGVDLRLDHIERAGELPGTFDRFVDRQRGMTGRDADAIFREELLGLVFVDVHGWGRSFA